MAVGWRTILRNPGFPYNWLTLSPRYTTLDTPDPIMQNTLLCCLEFYVTFTVGFKMKRWVKSVRGEGLTYTSVYSHTTTGGCHEPRFNTSHQEVLCCRAGQCFLPLLSVEVAQYFISSKIYNNNWNFEWRCKEYM
jgi:hypothetical protein